MQRMRLQRICVFCGSSAGGNPLYREQATAVGRILAARGIELVFGGGGVGLMGAVADSVLSAGGHVIGIIPRALVEREVEHRGIQDLRVVSTMHERKQEMASLSDAFLALPGGFGTLEEFCEVLTWSQLGLHGKACGLLNVAGFYDPLLKLFDSAVEQGFLRPAHRGLVLSGTDAAELIDRLAAFEAPRVEKWIRPSEA